MARMSPRERMVTAIRNGKPDRVPVAPDTSNMIPARRTGKVFWDIYVHDDPPLWRAYIDTVRHFGFDGWFIYSDMGYRYPDREPATIAYSRRAADRWVIGYTGRAGGEQYDYEWTYYAADPPTLTRKAIKDIEGQWKLVRSWFAPPTGYDPTVLHRQRQELGDLGAFGIHLCFPGFMVWAYRDLDGGLERSMEWYQDRHDLVLEIRDLHMRQLATEVEMALEEKPDFLLLGGSGTITLQSPAMARELSLPGIAMATRMAKQAGIPTMLHSCGKEKDLVRMCAEETDLDCINPLEAPPMGDCDLAEIKRLYGKRMALMGNLHTTEVMLFGSAGDVLEASRKAIEAAGSGGGFILSTGDQCGRDTPDENIRAMVTAAERYGRY